MASPVNYTDFEPLQPSADENIWQTFKKFMKAMMLWYRYYTYCVDSSGVPTSSWKADLCEGRDRVIT